MTYAEEKELSEARLAEERETLRRERDAAVARAERAEDALVKINNSIVGMQGFNFSEHGYPLVAALDEAGIEGMPCPEARKNLGTLIEQRDRAEAQRDALLAALERATSRLRLEHAPFAPVEIADLIRDCDHALAQAKGGG